MTDRTTRSDFVARWFPRASEAEVTAALSLLEMERSVLRMFTSCGWFFDDIDGLETRQVLRYAAHAIGEAGDEVHDFVANLRATLTQAVSNDRSVGTAAEVYDEESRDPAVVPLIVAAADEVARTFGLDGARVRSPAYSLEREGVSAVIVHRATGRRTVAEIHLEAAEPDVAVRVAPQHGSAHTFELGDFPDHVQREIAHARRALIADRWFTEREHGLLAAGHPIDQVVADTLAAGLRGLADDSDETPQRILDLAAYLTSLDTGLPFEVQAAYALIRPRLDPEIERQLSPRFGFA